jgi:hypothetical protein
MPKNPYQDKKTDRKRAVRSARPPARGRPLAVGDIMKKQSWIAGLQHIRDERQELLAQVSNVLPKELRGSLVSVEHKGGQLTVLTSSAAWCSRVRYALAALDPQHVTGRTDIVKMVVRVSPEGRAGQR